MKTAPTVILIINDGDDSFTTAITTGLQTSNLKQSTEVFELSLERYRVTDVKATGSVTHFVDSNGVKQVICKIRETLASASSLQFVKEKVTWNPKKTSKELEKEPWRALYG